MKKIQNIIKKMIDDFMKGFHLNTISGFLINNQEPVGLKAINLSYCTRPQQTDNNNNQTGINDNEMPEQIDINQPLNTHRTPKTSQSWSLPSNIQRSAFYKSLKDLEDKY